MTLEQKALSRFTETMFWKLWENRHKSGWRGVRPITLLRRLRKEVKELERAVGDKTRFEQLGSLAEPVE